MDNYNKKTKAELIKEIKSLHARIEGAADAASMDLRVRPMLENDYHTVFEQIDDGYWEVDLAGSITFFNEGMARITGFSPDEMIGLSYRNYMVPEVAQEVYSHFNAVFRSEAEKKTIMYEILRKDGQRRLVELSVSLIKSHEGKPAGFRGIMRIDEVVRLDSIPVLGTGKTDYRRLRTMIAERLE